jgi:hypothetical protein
MHLKPVVRMVHVRLHDKAGAACTLMIVGLLEERPNWESSGVA